MLTKNTLIDLWSMLSDIPTVINEDNYTVLDEDFLGWPAGTDVETVWHWFDDQFAKWGGVHVLMYDHPAPERKFQVWTPHGILECYAKHKKDSAADFPGVFVDLKVTDEQKAGKDVGDMICCVEYDSVKDNIRIVPQADLTTGDNPTLGDHWDPDTGIAVVTGYEEYLLNRD